MKEEMKFRPRILVIVYVVWTLLTMIAPALGGSLWPVYVPLVIIGLLYLVMVRTKTQRIIGVALTALAVLFIVSDLKQGCEWDMRMKEIELKSNMGTQPPT